jgi:predicted nucleotidyltransferase
MPERTVNNEITAIKDIILNTVDCERIYLFGSYAYGTPHKESDYDFYVVLKDGDENPLLPVQRIYKNLLQIQRMTPVDILAQHKSKFDDISVLPTMERKIVREGVLLYDSTPFA